MEVVELVGGLRHGFEVVLGGDVLVQLLAEKVPNLVYQSSVSDELRLELVNKRLSMSGVTGAHLEDGPEVALELTLKVILGVDLGDLNFQCRRLLLVLSRREFHVLDVSVVSVDFGLGKRQHGPLLDEVVVLLPELSNLIHDLLLLSRREAHDLILGSGCLSDLSRDPGHGARPLPAALEGDSRQLGPSWGAILQGKLIHALPSVSHGARARALGHRLL
mmetsp:Transcript_25256/g.52465  ORF Transcript_25256/g.52465 Transcript_25256/m.52465 type:complete len:219 (-) Transcript_25256:916-1572(-)